MTTRTWPTNCLVYDLSPERKPHFKMSNESLSFLSVNCLEVYLPSLLISLPLSCWDGICVSCTFHTMSVMLSKLQGQNVKTSTTCCLLHDPYTCRSTLPMWKFPCSSQIPPYNCKTESGMNMDNTQPLHPYLLQHAHIPIQPPHDYTCNTNNFGPLTPYTV